MQGPIYDWCELGPAQESRDPTAVTWSLGFSPSKGRRAHSEIDARPRFLGIRRICC